MYTCVVNKAFTVIKEIILEEFSLCNDSEVACHCSSEETKKWRFSQVQGRLVSSFYKRPTFPPGGPREGVCGHKTQAAV